MNWQTDIINLSSEQKYELIDITPEVEEKVTSSKVREGVCLIAVPHATAGLVVNEDEKGVREDILDRILALAPEDIAYQHDRIDNNARAHVISSIIGTDKVFIIEDSQLVRGTWQNIFFLELDGPRSARRIVIKIFGE